MHAGDDAIRGVRAGAGAGIKPPSAPTQVIAARAGQAYWPNTKMKVAIDVHETVVRSMFSGEVALDAAREHLQNIFDTTKERQLHKVLIDCLAIQGQLTTLERYQLGTWAARYIHQLGINLRTAFLGVPPVVDGFGLLVARNRGLNAQLFSAIPDAQKWLR